MSIVLLARILASFGFKIYEKLENLENLGCHGNGEENQQTFDICVHHSMSVKNEQNFRKIYFFYFQAILEGV